MVTVRLFGGLGNQMFQYAAGRQLALMLNTELAFDVSDLENPAPHETPRQYELDCFTFKKPRVVKLATTPPELIFGISGLTKYLLDKVGSKPRPALTLTESHFPFSKRLLKVQRDWYLFGHWQGERYFKEAESNIRKDFVFIEMDEQNQALASKIKLQEAISIHVRRGDYVSDSATNKFHGVTPIEYYRNAINHFETRIKEPRYYVFSDEPEWCEANLSFKSDQATFISDNTGSRSFRDMQLMSLCKHHILANSSFSWWGAWLNSSSNKIVVAPKRWLLEDGADNPYRIPESWIKL